MLNFELISNEKINPSTIVEIFQNNPINLEELLFKIHFKRKQQLTVDQRYNILCFLHTCYSINKDVRFYNEFLWFYKKNIKYSQILENIKILFRNLTEKTKYHPFPTASSQEMYNYLLNFENKISSIEHTKIIAPNINVSLIGFPLFFKKAFKNLKLLGISPDIFFIPYHPNKILNFVFSNKFLLKTILWINKFNENYITINLNKNDPSITDFLKSKNVELGFHKLPFIIKENILLAYKIGIINDHWAILPFIRGKSTIEYSLLFNAPIAITTHFITSKIDEGEIVNIYQYPDSIKKNKKIIKIKKIIKNGLSTRIINSIILAANQKNGFIKNEIEKGLTFYSMHPELQKYIEKEILK